MYKYLPFTRRCCNKWDSNLGTSNLKNGNRIHLSSDLIFSEIAGDFPSLASFWGLRSCEVAKKIDQKYIDGFPYGKLLIGYNKKCKAKFVSKSL